MHDGDSKTAASPPHAIPLDAAPDPTLIVGPDGTILAANRQACLLFDYQAADLIGLPIEHLIPESLRAAHVRHRSQYLTNPQNRPMGTCLQLRALRSNGTEVPVDISLNIIGDTGTPFIVAAIRNISARVDAERALMASEERFRRMFQDGPLGACLIDIGLRILSVNPPLCDLLGYSADDLHRMTLTDLTHPDDRHLDADLARAVLETRTPAYQVEKRCVTKHGDVIWVQVTATVTRDQRGTPLYGIAILQDITERIHLQEARISRERYRAISELTSDLGYSFLIEGDVLTPEWASDAFETVTGYTLEEWWNHGGWTGLVHPDDQPMIHDVLRSIATGQATVDEFRIIRKDGEVRWLRAFVRGEDCPDGTRRVFGAAKDITQRKRAEEEFRAALEHEAHAAERLREVDQTKTAFMRAVSHDLRTPTTTILGFVELLQHFGADAAPDQARIMLERIGANARRINALLDDLLDLDRLERGELEPARTNTDVAALIARCVEHAPMEGHAVHVEAAPGLTASVDPRMMDRILDNLLSNAARHTPQQAQVWVNATLSGDDLTITVEDNGPGIPDHLKAMIFEPFKQGASNLHVPGSGIGLSLVSRFAEMHGGRAWVEDRPGGGARFVFLLPGSRPA